MRQLFAGTFYWVALYSPRDRWYRQAIDLSRTFGEHHLCTHGHDRLCWLSQKRAEKQSCTECLKAREIAYMPLVTLAPMASEIYHRDLTNRVTTSFTLVGHGADSPEPI
jgi:hypothetical protein